MCIVVENKRSMYCLGVFFKEFIGILVVLK